MNRRWLLFAVALGALGMLFPVMFFVPMMFGSRIFFGAGGGGTANCVDTSEAGAQPAAASDARAIPADYYDLYRKAGTEYGIPWNVLAGVGKVETSHGTSRLPGVSSGENYAGAGGPMQFLEPTFRAFGVDGNGDGEKDRYDPEDAIPSAARYLKHNGAPERMRTALFMYNHSWDYVNLVLEWARRYAGRDFTLVQANGIECQDNQLPANANELIQEIIEFAMAQRGKRYVFGANGPDAWDCSSLIQGAYRSVGLSIPRTTFLQWPFGAKVTKGQEQPGDLVFFNSGPGTGPNRPGHVGMVIAKNKMIVASCATCSPNIGVQPYQRGDWVGTTRPLASPDLKSRVADLAARP
jgi:hypothetical protein